MLILAICFSVITAQAAPNDPPEDQDRLWNQYEKESSFQPVTLQSPGLTGDIRGFLLPDGRVKLSFVGSEIKTEAQISSPEFANYVDEQRYRLICDHGESRFPEIRAKKHSYQLKFKIFPMQQDQALSVTSNGKNWSTDNLSTEFQPVEFIYPKVTVQPDAASLQAGLSSNQIVDLFASQLKKESLPDSGEINLNLTSYDDVACDLIEGKINIRFMMAIHFDSPLLFHETRMTENQMARVYEKVRSTWQPPSDADQAKILAGYRLAGGTAEANLNTTLKSQEILRLYRLLFDAQIHLKTLTSADYSPTAKRMDLLSSRTEGNVSTYSVDVATPKFGKRSPRQ